MIKEIWKDIPGYEGLYQVSNLGRIKTSTSNIIKCCKKNPKYNKVKGYIWRYKSEVMPNANEKCVLF